MESGDITATAGKNQIQVAFKKCAQFTKCITKIDGTAIDDAYIWRLKFDHGDV